jgi:cobalt-zinc-cadmium efflux system protein
MSEHHSHHHDHTHGANKKALSISLILIGVFMLVEVIGGLLTNSLALLSDAGHMLSDAISLLVALMAFKIGERTADTERTFGYKRFEILAAMFNGATLIVIAIAIFIGAIGRFINPPEIASTGMLVIAVIGLLVNLIVAKILTSGDTHDNLNMRGAFLHVLGDLFGSVAAIVAALSIMFFGWGFMDPLASVIVAILITVSGWRVLRQSLHVLMEGVPEGINLDKLTKTMNEVEGVEGVHHVHVWTITSGFNAMSGHIVVNGQLNVHETQKIIQAVESKMKEIDINHVTLQVECKHKQHSGHILCDEVSDVSETT